MSVRGATTIDRIPAIRNELLRDAGIRGVAVAQNTPADGNNSVDMRTFEIEEEGGAMGRQMLSIQSLGQDYEKVMGMTITQGRNLSSRLPGDAGGIPRGTGQFAREPLRWPGQATGRFGLMARCRALLQYSQHP